MKLFYIYDLDILSNLFSFNSPILINNSVMFKYFPDICPF